MFMEKEKLTNYNIKQDIKSVFLKNLVYGIGLFTAYLVCLLPIWLLYYFDFNLLFIKIAFIIVVIIYCVYLISFLKYIIKLFVAMTKERFYVFKDKVVGLNQNEVA